MVKFEPLYHWVSTVLFPASGPLLGCIGFPDGPTGAIDPQHADNDYDAGTFMEAGDALYRATGNKEYEDDALRTANRWVSDDPVASNARLPAGPIARRADRAPGQSRARKGYGLTNWLTL